MHPHTAARLLTALAVLSTTWFATTAQAVPSYARQTGQDCVACHVGAFGPQLTPFGMKFKINGYTDSDGKDGKVPLSGMLVAAYTHNSDQDTAKLDEASIFLAGKMTDHLGTFVQLTHDGVEHHNALDQVDVRYAVPLTLYGKESVLGVSINNNPGVQDPFNTLPVWGFPYTGSPYSNAMGAELVGFAGLEQRVVGVNAYTLWNDSVYGELGVYNSLSPSLQSRLGAGRDDAIGTGSLHNAAYWRLGYLQDEKTQSWNVGVVGFNGTLKDRETGDTVNKFNDLGFDFGYQYLGNRKNVCTLNGSFMREKNAFTGVTTKDFKLNTSYHYLNTWGATAGLFKATTSDSSADNTGYVLQADWTPWGKETSWGEPWANVRLGAQFTGYNKYIEDGTELDKPSDKNTFFLFAWTSF